MDGQSGEADLKKLKQTRNKQANRVENGLERGVNVSEVRLRGGDRI